MISNKIVLYGLPVIVSIIIISIFLIINAQQEEESRMDAESSARIDVLDAKVNAKINIINNFLSEHEQLLYDCEFIKTYDEYNNLISRYNNLMTKIEIMIIDDFEELEFTDKHLEQINVVMEKGMYIEDRFNECLDEHSERLFN